MIIRANTTSIHTVYFYDESATPVVPTSGTYGVEDLGSGTVVVTPTTFTPSTPFYAITLSPTQNAMLTSGDILERRDLSVSFTYSGTMQGASNEILTINASNVTVSDVMENLLGWELDTQVTDDEYDVTEDMVEKFIVKALIRVANFLHLTSTNALPSNSDVVDESVSIWAAGLLWDWKYTVDTPDVTSLRYGSHLIADAKNLLEQYIENVSSGGSGITWTKNTSLGEWDETKEYYAYDELGTQDLDERDPDIDYSETR